MRARMVGLFAAAAPVVFGAGSAFGDSGPVARAAAVCAEYGDQAQAQRAADTRDPDGDGLYCESLPCPCLGPGEGGGGDPQTASGHTKRKPRAQRVQARITSVTDGDTLRVRAFRAKRKNYRVRLIGIDTPESVKPGTPVECGGKEATDAMVRLAFASGSDTDGDGLLDEGVGRGRRVVLVTDPTQDRFDYYGRLLAYVTRSGTDFGARQLRAGWAEVYVFEKRFRRYARYKRAEDSAQAAKRGVWDVCGGDIHRSAEPPESPPAPAPTPTPTPTPGDSCNPNYSGACLPLTEDVDCSEIPERNFYVVGTDEFALDGNDNDGIACES
jgi:endonuclease YncB( thermonuclease family)